MNVQNWALMAEIIGVVALIVSVIYLGQQIKDNTRLLRSQAHYNALSLAQRPLEMMVENESLAGTGTRCDASTVATAAALPPMDWERCLNYYFIQFNAWEYMYYQHQDGSIPKQLWVGADAYFKSLARTKPGYFRFWGEMEGAFDEPFRTYAANEFKAQAAGSVDTR